MKKSKIFFAFACSCILFAALTGCNNSPSDDDNKVNESPKSSEKTLIEFSFEKANNSGLSADVKGTIDETNKTVSVEVPSGTDKTKLKASFKISGKAKLFIGTAEQQSSVTENDFSDNAGVTYTVKAEDGSQQNYTVKVVNENPKSSEKQILIFMFVKEDNAGFTDAGALGTIDEPSKKITVILSNGTDITKLKARFSLSDGARASVNGIEQESMKTENDFTAPVSYTITAEDGSTQIYTVKVGLAPKKPDVPEEITEKAFADLPADEQTEIKTLYGYYWSSDGTKSECPAIDADRLGVYTGNEFMSMGFTNLRWSKVSSSTWACFSYAEDDEDYGAKRLIFTFMKDADGTVWLWDTIVAMANSTYGPYVIGKTPDTFEEGGKTYYTYDKAIYDKNPKRSPKLFELTMK